jgi:putative ABC transport system permease protein
MIKSYFKIAWRNIIKNKVSSIINIGGLAVGIAVVMLIALWIWDEVTFDNYHVNHKQLAQVMSTSFNDKNEAGTGSAVAMPVGNELKTKYGSDFKIVSLSSWIHEHTIALGDKRLTANGIWVESGFPSMFTLKMLRGNNNALSDPSSVLLSASVAKSMFGNSDPLNKTLKFDNKTDFKVAGVFEDLPNNTTLNDIKFLLPWKKYITTENWLRDAETQWNNHSFQCYVQINDNIDIKQLSGRIKKLMMAHKNAIAEGKEELLLHPMDKWHLYNEFENGSAAGGRIQFVWLFTMIGIFILILACINFINLSTAKSEKRAKEVGIRKSLGSLKLQLIGQFLSESVTVAFIALILSILLVALSIPIFNELSGKDLHLPVARGSFWLAVLVLTLISGLMAGSYPALYFSRFEPVKVLKGTFKAGKLASLPRKVLVVIQFTFSIALIIGTVVVFKQIQYAKNRPISYESEGLITLNMSREEVKMNYNTLRSDLLSTGVINDMAKSNSPTTKVTSNNIGFSWEGKNPGSIAGFGTIAVSANFGKTIGWKVLQGRDFSEELSTDSSAIILNEAAVKQIGTGKDLIGQNIQYRQKNYMVVGVIKDIIMESPYQPVRPTIFFNDMNGLNTITISLKKGVSARDALSKTATVFKAYNLPFDYHFNDEDYAKKFADEQRIARLATFFTILAIFISCLGLFGLASYVAEQRTKEIGIRKVLGASIINLWAMLLKDFLILIFVACAIAIPISNYILQMWLQQYEYHTTISAAIFVVTILSTTGVTLLAISWQTLKAAMTDPIKSLKAE